MKHIGILGAPYSGSTVVSQILGGLVGVETVGEAHHIVTKPEWGICSFCGEACEVLTVGLRRRLRAVAPSPTWYQTLGLAVGAATAVVSSDKDPALYERCSSSRPNVALFVHKDPRAHVLSLIRHAAHQVSDGNVEEAIRTWCGYYQRAMAWTEGVPRVGLELEMLVDAPEPTLRRLCDRLEVPCDAGALWFWRRRPHQIGGNSQTVFGHDDDTGVPVSASWVEKFRKRLGRDDRFETELPKALSDRIVTDSRVREVRAWLNALG